MGKICKFFKKFHYSIGLILLAFAAVNIFEVFYKYKPPAVVSKFGYFEPTIFMPFLLGIIQTAVLSFDKEKSLFKIENKGVFISIFLRLIDIFGFCFLNILFIYMSNILSENAVYERRSTISLFHLFITIIQLLLAITSIIYSEYIIYKSSGDDVKISKKQLLIQGVLYGVTSVMIISTIIFVEIMSK